jgi:hypothetical protein
MGEKQKRLPPKTFKLDIFIVHSKPMDTLQSIAAGTCSGFHVHAGQWSYRFLRPFAEETLELFAFTMRLLR